MGFEDTLKMCSRLFEYTITPLFIHPLILEEPLVLRKSHQWKAFGTTAVVLWTGETLVEWPWRFLGINHC
jgi:hypothetical protein